jgi:hypothetical protein
MIFKEFHRSLRLSGRMSLMASEGWQVYRRKTHGVQPIHLFS